ncbi:MAG: mechanosensitive ion channel family protein [Cyanobacteria bacterium Co-bin8]|nr:mechanosensitive ion channel family protein [Cyanobacteria bacterium Co-bin8]
MLNNDLLELWGSPVGAYGGAIATLLIGLAAINILRQVVLSRMKRWASRTATDLDDRLISIIEAPAIWLLYLGVLFLSIQDLILQPSFPSLLGQVIPVLCLVLGTVLGIHLVSSILEYLFRFYWVTYRNDLFMEQTLKALIPALKVVVWTVGIIFLLDNLGLDVSAAVTSLGIGGVALALASQGILADVFGYFAILFDRPFDIGDFISLGTVSGTVESVGLKTTRLRASGGEELIIPNTDMTKARIQNFGRMQRRRVVLSIKVSYTTPPEKLETIPPLIQQIIEATDQVSFDRAHFLGHGEYSLNYEAVYFVETSDHSIYMNAQQAINLAISLSLQQQGIELALPFPREPATPARLDDPNSPHHHESRSYSSIAKSSPTAF